MAVTGNKRLNHIHHCYSEYKGKKTQQTCMHIYARQGEVGCSEHDALDMSLAIKEQSSGQREQMARSGVIKPCTEWLAAC